MPPETLPWDRFKERRYDRPSSEGPGPRWHDLPPHHHDFRGRLGDNVRPVSWRYHSAESDRGFSAPRVNDKFIDDEEFRPSGYRIDPRYNRFNREIEGPFIHRDVRGHFWENGMYPNSSDKLHFGRDRRYINDRVRSFGQKDHFWENGRMQNGSDQRSLDEKGSFRRRGLRGKSWENGLFPNSSIRRRSENNPCSVDDKAHFEKKGLKRCSPDYGVFLNSSGQKDLKEESCDHGVFPNGSGRLHTGSDRSSMDANDIKGQSVENGVVPNLSRKLDTCSNHSPVDDMLIFTSPTHSALAGTHDEHSKDNCDKSSGSNDVAKFEKENLLVSIDWKPLKWPRKLKSPDSAAPKNEIPPRGHTPLWSPTGNAVACATVSAVSSEEGGEKKKPRLGWGEGLAKFEKKQVEGPDDDSATKPGLVVCVSGEPFHVSNLVDRSPRVAGFLECATPVTPSSVACSPSPADDEDKACIRSENLDYDTSYSSGSPNRILQHIEGNQEREFCLENVELSVANLTSSLTKLCQLEDSAIVESSFMKSNAMNKLLVWRGEALKALEVTESEIESLENDLTKLNSESASNCPHSATSSSLHGDCQAKPCEDSLANYLSKDYSQVRSDDLHTPTVELHSEVKGVLSSDSVNGKSYDNMVFDALENVESSPMYDSLSSVTGEALSDRILASNKDATIEAYEVFNKLLPSNHSSIHVSIASNYSSWKEDSWIMDKFAFKNRSRRFDEKVNTFKYRALQHLWKQDLQRMSFKKNRPKSHKRSEISTRGPYGSNHKHRSFRSCFSNAAENLSLVPTTEAINFTSKLLSDSPAKSFRNFLKMPALFMDKERTLRFISNNGLVEDPCAMEKERAMINPWTKEEKDIFMDRLATFGKNFSKICLFLDHKTIADCVEFYYKNHKSDSFVKLKKKAVFAKQGKSYSFNNYLVGSAKRLNRETNAASLDVLGEASEIAANAGRAMKTGQQTSGSMREKLHDVDVSIDERETEAADVLAGICGSISSEPMSSCITSFFDLGESYKELKNQRVGNDDNSCSDDSRGEVEYTDWTDEERSSLIQAVASCGNDFATISKRAGTKSRDQCRVFFCKARKHLGLDTSLPTPCGEGNNDNTDGSCDNEGACFVEADSVVSSEKSSSKGDKDVLLSEVDKIDLDKNKCKDYDDLEMIVDDLTGESKPDIGLEDDLDMENCVDNEPAVVSDPMGDNDCKAPNELEKIIVDDLTVESKPEIGLEGDLDLPNGVINEHVIVSGPMGENGGDLDLPNGVINGHVIVSGPMGEYGCKAPNELEKMILDDLTGEDKPKISLESDLDMANGVDNEPKMVSNPIGNALQLDIVEDKGNEVAISSVRSEFADEASDNGISVPCEHQVEEHEMVIETNSCGKIDENSPSDKQEANRNGLTDLNCVDQELHASVNASNVIVGSFDSIPLKAQNDFDRIIQKLYTKSTSVGTQHESSSSGFFGFPLQVSVKKEMKGNYSSEEGFLCRCSGSDIPSSKVQFPFQPHEQKKSHLCSSSDTEKPKRNGDVILFGQILKSRTEGSMESTPANINQKYVTNNHVDSYSVVGNFDHNS